MHTTLTPVSSNNIHLSYPEGFIATSCIEKRSQELKLAEGSVKVEEC
ncbi:hypothetical protein SAMN05192574_103179 [Mucilaginibacter gossypiicola]|uniref:Uncharacterized protein n=1 Tax=Mucilaginibacter gossypiicola TaxID=551995 RepID=A0A1H8GKX8_9SPHI|nr:hypothetical protein [Mucilaginibacter gossypiicola]SEN44404.1 hypothetical protein SAMN05192574_103179 [Mucilaginibacter gossypiicola]